MTREEAIERLEWLEMVAEYVDSVTIGSKCTEDWDAYNMAIAALREQDSNANQHVSNTSNALGGWNSVEERLPVPNTLVLVTWHRVEKELRIGFGRLQQHGVWYVSNEGMPKVTHWMPLPELPKEEV